MRTRDTLLLGAALGAAAALGLKAWRRRQRRIELDGRVVVITGASSGHGYLVARHAARRRGHLVLAARSLEPLKRAEPELIGLGARSVTAEAVDVADEPQVVGLIERTVRRFGRLDVLINNAGVISVGPVESMTLDDFREAMAVNFWGAVHATLAALPQMRRQKFGRIANVVSLGGKAAAPHLLPYTASKFALTGFTEGLRAELAKDDILVTGLYPATMRTGGHTHARFKGDPNAEYTWFGLSDTLPGLSVSADRVAHRLVEAVCDGEAEVWVGWPTWVAALFQSLIPNETAEMAALVNRMLPAPGSNGRQAVRGEDLKGPTANWLNRAIPPSTRPGWN